MWAQLLKCAECVYSFLKSIELRFQKYHVNHRSCDMVITAVFCITGIMNLMDSHNVKE